MVPGMFRRGYATSVSDELFVGRRAELTRLHALLDGLSAGVGGLVLVEGEQGIGKSALLRTGLAAAESSGFRVLWGTADELGQGFPLSLMAECLGVPVQAVMQPPAAGTVADPEAGTAGGLMFLSGDPVLAGMERLLARVDRLCAASPVVLVADGLQWADEASVLAWYRLSRAVRQLPLLLVGSCRPQPAREDLAQLRRGLVSRDGSLLELGPLPDEDVAELAGRLAGGDPGRQLTALLARAGGNPLYARELVDGLVRDGRIRVQAGAAELVDGSAALPAAKSLTAAVAERLGYLPEDVVGVLRWAAVLGQEFSVTDLEMVTGKPAGDLVSAVDSATAGGVIVEAGPRLGFRHGLIRQVLYEGMPAALRTALHLQAARALAGAGAAPERVAGQLVAAPGGVADGWMLDWLAGAMPMLNYRAPQLTAELLRGVLGQLADDDPRRDALEASLAETAFVLVRYDEVEQVGGRALARAADPDRAAELAWLVGYTLARTGRAPGAAALVAEVLARPGVSELQQARLRALQATALTVQGELDQAAAAGAAALAGAERTGDPYSIGYALHALSGVDVLRRDHDARLAHIDRALQVIGADPRAVDLRLLLLSNRPAALLLLDRRAEALDTAQQALVEAEQAGTSRLRLIRTALACLYYEAGRWDDAIAELEVVVDLPGPFYHDLVVHGVFALISARRGEMAAAAEHLAAVPGQPVRDAADWHNAYSLLQAQAQVADLDGRPADAVAVLARCLWSSDAKEAQGRYQVAALLVRLALAVSDHETAAAAADAAAQEALADPRPVKAAVADYCRGLLAGDPAPVLAAAAYFKATERPPDHGQALEDAAALAAARGDGLPARQALDEALSVYAALGAQWDIRRALARLRQYGIRRGRSGAQRPRPQAGWHALTRTEVKVARLVGAGLSNPDIAARLFLSRNTVQTHVSHILAKLGARSRAEIIRESLDHPPDPERASA
jgi:DNA-binding CsgD family transcriptional regulator/tetratricopeptide (TPR) repeat protein